MGIKASGAEKDRSECVMLLGGVLADSPVVWWDSTGWDIKVLPVNRTNIWLRLAQRHTLPPPFIILMFWFHLVHIS